MQIIDFSKQVFIHMTRIYLEHTKCQVFHKHRIDLHLNDALWVIQEVGHCTFESNWLPVPSGSREWKARQVMQGLESSDK